MRLAILAMALPTMLPAGHNQWTAVGPEGGTVPALAADPQNPSTVYAATCVGLFKTVDGGANWSAISFLPAPFDCGYPALGSLALDPQNSGTVYAISRNQILKTTDGGANWSAIVTPKTANSLFVLLIAPSNPNTLYASDGDTLLQSKDAGATWTQVSVGVHPPIAVDPQNENTLYADTAGGLFKTTDAGVDWNPANSGLTVPGHAGPGVGVLAIDPRNPDTLYAGGAGGIFKSTDGGASWNLASAGLPPPPAPSSGYIQVVSLAVHPQTPGAVYALIHQVAFDGKGVVVQSSFRLAVSTDGAASWNMAAGQVPSSGAFAVSPDPQDAGTLYVGTNDGVWKTTDGGGQWNFASSGMRAAGVWQVLIDPQDGVLLAPAYKSVDGGATWSRTAAAPGVAVADPQNPHTLYAPGRQGMYQSVDFGDSWTKIGSYPASIISPNMVLGPLAIAAARPNVMYMGISPCFGSCFSRIGKSTDGGRTWQDSQVALMTAGCCAQIQAVAVDPQNPEVVYGGSGDDWDDWQGGLWKSTDGGVSWVSLSQSFAPPARELGNTTSVLVDPGSPDTIYAIGDGLFKSIDGGQSWVLSSLRCGGPLVMDPQDSATLYCVVGVGIYYGESNQILRSTDAGASWTDAGPVVSGSLNSLTIDPQDARTLYAATSTGLFAMTLDAQ